MMLILSGPDDPIVIAAKTLGVILSAPFALLIGRGFYFLGRVSKQFGDLVTSVDKIEKKLEEYAGESQSHVWSFAIIEEDINALQRKAGVEIREYPNRRVGPPDRRHA
jgi:hypothetical protein